MPTEVSIEAVFAHVHAIIDQGREAEFIQRCSEVPFGRLTVPDDLIGFTREFLKERSPTGALPTFSEALNPSTKSMLDLSLQTDVSRINSCRC